MPAPRRLPTPARTAPDAPDAAAVPASVTRVVRRFRLVFNAVKTHFQQVERKAGIGGAQLWALSIIEAQPDIGVGGLARAMDVHPTTASNLVRSLVTQALVQARRGAPDRRAVQLSVTAAGTRVLHKAPGPFAGVLPDALARLDDDTLARLNQDLGTLIQLLQTDERAAGIPLAQM